jgi:hypothetical protein
MALSREHLWSDSHFADILACKCDLFWDWCPSFGEYSSQSLDVDHRDPVVFQAAKDVNASEDTLIDLFSRIERFFKRLESYTEVLPTSAMTGITVEIMVEVLKILAIATKEIKQGRSSEPLYINYSFLTYSSLGRFMKKLLGKNDIEDALKRLDMLTQEEVRMATAEVLKVTHRVDDNVRVLVDGAHLFGFSPRLRVPDVGLIRWERNKSNCTANCSQCRRREAFVVRSWLS